MGLIRIFAAFLILNSSHAQAQKLRPFTIKDEIGQSKFPDLYNGDGDGQSSPKGDFVVFKTERGLLDRNEVQDVVVVYDTHALRDFVNGPTAERAPRPFWIIDGWTSELGPVVTKTRWLRDSSGFAVLLRTRSGTHQLVLTDIRSKTISSLTPEEQDVTAFDMRDRSHFVYTVRDSAIYQQSLKERRSTAINATDRSLFDILFPVDQHPELGEHYDRSELWAVRGGKPFQVIDEASGRAIALFSLGQLTLALSPRADLVATSVAVHEIPKEWETLYPRFHPGVTYRMQAGPQDTDSFWGLTFVSRYATIDLSHGRIAELNDAPTGPSAKWTTSWTAPITWSDDGHKLLLPGAFWTGANPQQYKIGPWVLAVDNVRGTVEYIDTIKSFADASENIFNIRFAPGDDSRVLIESRTSNLSKKVRSYLRSSDGEWKLEQAQVPAVLEFSVHQSLNERPELVAADPKTHLKRAVWDPNPQFDQINFGEASVYHWKDRTGREWTGGLYKPPDYEFGRRYPLVIQTHGFSEYEFNTSGMYTTAFAARALAGAGIMVLQVLDCPIRQSPEEGPCQVPGYESAISHLSAEGLIDPSLVGIVGFSRSCFYVLEALTASNFRFKAASITEGVTMGYLQYLMDANFRQESIQRDSEASIGARPFGAGLETWLRKSPEFNMDKVTAPLEIVALGQRSLLTMWETYAALHYLKKPVDVLVINSVEHVLTNPAARLASQGGTVDWFRFWLQDYKDPDPGKVEQYKRWEGLRDSKNHDKHLGGTAAPAALKH